MERRRSLPRNVCRECLLGPLSPLCRLAAEGDGGEEVGGTVIASVVAELQAGEPLHRADVIGIDLQRRGVAAERIIDAAGTFERECQVDARIRVPWQKFARPFKL